MENDSSPVSALGALNSVGASWPTHHVPLQYGATPDVADLRRTAILLDDGELYLERRWGFHTDDGWVHWTDWPHAGHYEQ